jgi:hypothetical protein
VSEPGRYDQVVCDMPDGKEPRTWGGGTRTIANPQGGEESRRPSAGERPPLAITNAYPSPARGATRIEFTLPASGRARVAIVDALGRRVATLADGARASGSHAVTWDGRTVQGTLAAPGVYQAIVTFQGESCVRRFVRIR